jgi:hypothetical protein
LPTPPPIQKTANAPKDLLSHKVCNTTLSLKRPRLVLDEATSPGRNRYPQFSSSPNSDKHSAMTRVEFYPDQENEIVGRGRCDNSTEHATSRANSTMDQSKRFVRPAITMHTTSMAILQQNTTGRKTYGTRRSLNSGWDARKHK